MKTFLKIVCAAAILWGGAFGLLSLPDLLAPEIPREAMSCHPGQHRCQTDAECEDEEAYFLDLEEGRQE